MKVDINSLKADREAKLAEARALVEKAEAEKRNLNEDEAKSFDALRTAAAEYNERIERAEVFAAGEGYTPSEVAPTMPDASIGMSKTETKSYSFIKAIRAAISGDWSKAGLELEASKAAEKNIGQKRGSFVIPHDVLIEQRDLTVGTGTGDQIVGTNLMAGSFIEALRNRMVLKQAGAGVMAGLVGDVAIPKRVTSTTAYWVTEDGAPSESASAFGQVSLSPKTVAAYEDISRKLILQGTPDAEKLVRDDMVQSLALAIDLAGFHGTGANYQPTGIAATNGIGSVVGGANGAAPDRADIIDLETAVAVDNADVGRLSYVTNALVRGKLKQTETVSGSGQFVWNDNMLNGYNAYVSNQISSTLTKGTSTAKCSAIFYGNFADLIIAMWGGLDVLVDQYSLSTTGQVRLVAFQSVDIAIRRAQSFAAMLDALTA